MVPNSELLYWEEKKHNGIDNFSKKYPEKPCWEMASELGDFRSVFKICNDCIVFLLKNGSLVLSEKEVCSIVKRKVSCRFFHS